MKKKKAIITSIAFLLSSMICVFTVGYSWFAIGEGTKVSTEINGSLITRYFESGDGSQEHPYEIKYPVQLYYLAWFQEMGYFNMPETAGSSNIPTTYFRLSSDLNMNENGTQWVLPAIGTQTYEFLGNFDGRGHVISNLIVSNENDNLTDSPETSLGGVDIIGLFGVVGSLSDTYDENETTATVNKAMVNKVAQNGTYTYSTTANEVKDLTINNITIRSESESDNTLIGLAAGYVNGDMSGVKVIGKGKLEVSGQNALTNITSDLSEYSLVGYSTKLAADTVLYKHDISRLYDSDTEDTQGGEGQGDEWGGSIDMKSLNQRLQNMFDDTNAAYYFYGTSDKKRMFSYVDEYNYLTEAWNAEVDIYYLGRNQNTQRTFYRLNGAGKYGPKAATAVQLPGTVLPLLTENSSSYEPLLKNTGYIIGGTKETGSILTIIGQKPAPTVTSSSYELEWIAHSLKHDKTYSESDINNRNTGINTYDASQFEILTNKEKSYSSSSFVAIKDSYNQNHTIPNTSALSGYIKDDSTTPAALGLEKYNNSRVSLDEILDGSTFIHGLHFNERQSAISTSQTVTMPKVRILNQEKTNYKFPKSCIDFNLKETGKINFFSGSYYAHSSGGTNYSGADSFFSLYSITRDNSDELTSIKQISIIYKNNNYVSGGSEPKYIYRYSDNSYSGNSSNCGELLFDMRYLTEEPPVRNAVYYFEIPVNKGEYAMATVEGKTGGGYLMYLDIGASGEKEDEDKILAYSVTLTKNFSNYPIGVDFGISGINALPPGGKTIGANIKSDNKTGSVEYTVSGNDININIDTITTNYTYQSGSNLYTTSGDTPGNEINIKSVQTRYIYISYTPVGGVEQKIVIIDNIENDEIQSTEVTVDGVASNVNSLDTSVKDILDNLRALSLSPIATITRTNGNTDYNITDLGYSGDDKKTVNLVVDGTGITVNVTNIADGYTIIINNDEIPTNGNVVIP